MSEQIKISIPTTALLSNLELILRIKQKIEEVTGEKLPSLTATDLVVNIETRGMSIKTDLITGLEVTMDVEFFGEMLQVHGDVALSLIDAGIIVKNAVEKATSNVEKLNQKWVFENNTEE